MQIPGRVKKNIRKYKHSLIYVLLLLFVACSVMLNHEKNQHKPYIYKVQSGDSLESIASLCELNTEQIISFNELKTNKVSIGDIILLPGVRQLYRGEALQKLSILPRQIWGALAARPMKHSTPLSRITVHHTSDSANIILKDDRLFLKSIQRHHQKTNKWADIAYHFLIGRDGEIYQGRELFWQGAHVKQHNSGNIGIALLGNYHTHQLNNNQKTALLNLLEALRERYDISRSKVYGHTHLGKTQCPGKHTLAFLRKYKMAK